MASQPNVLFVVLDQLRADCVFGALAEHVNLPNMRALAADGVTFRNHFSVTSPCGPSRVSLLTGQYAMNHRAVRNGTPSRADTPTLATEARKAGYDPLLFGYTDTAQDPRHLSPDDPRLYSYEELSPGFTEALRLRMESDSTAWEDHLRGKGYDVPAYPETYRPTGPNPSDPAFYSAEDSDTAFLTDRVLEDLENRTEGWFATVTYVRPHPPFVAPTPYNKMYDPAKVPSALSFADNSESHAFLECAREAVKISSTVEGFPDLAPTDENVRLLRSIYFGLATEVDHHIGRLIDWLNETDQIDRTLIVVTADHGDMLGDYGLWGKRTYFDASFHVPLIIRSPDGARGNIVTRFTESIDVTPTILDFLGVEIPHGMDGFMLRPFVEGIEPETWREFSVSELDFGDPIEPTHWQRRLGVSLDEANVSVLRSDKHRYVQFAADLPSVLFDMEAAGEAENIADRPGVMPILLDLSRQMLCHRMRNTDGTFSRTMVTSTGVKVGAS
ncbi:MAG: sulfatase-like hydrolase/transferase [Boseongicola sp.]